MAIMKTATTTILYSNGFLLIAVVCQIPTTEKRGYPSIFKTTGIAPESAGIGSKFLSRCFISRRFKPSRSDSQYRVVELVPALLKSIGIGPGAFQTLFRRFYLCRDNLYRNMNITSKALV